MDNAARAAVRRAVRRRDVVPQCSTASVAAEVGITRRSSMLLSSRCQGLGGHGMDAEELRARCRRCLAVNAACAGAGLTLPQGGLS